MKLYEIAQEIEQVLDNIDNIDQVSETMQQELERLDLEFDAKVENIVLYIKGLQVDVDALKAEEERLANRRRSIQKTIDWLKSYINTHTGTSYKLKTPLVSVHKITTTTVDIPDEYDMSWLAGFYPLLCKEKLAYSPDKNAIKTHLAETGLPLTCPNGSQIQIINNSHVVVR